VTEDQMRALFGQGEHPNSDAMVAAYIREHIRPGMTGRQREEPTAAAIRHATLGSQFPAFKNLALSGVRTNFCYVSAGSDVPDGVRSVVRWC
jgi:hypothetical protein